MYEIKIIKRDSCCITSGRWVTTKQLKKKTNAFPEFLDSRPGAIYGLHIDSNVGHCRWWVFTVNEYRCVLSSLEFYGWLPPKVNFDCNSCQLPSADAVKFHFFMVKHRCIGPISTRQWRETRMVLNYEREKIDFDAKYRKAVINDIDLTQFSEGC